MENVLSKSVVWDIDVRILFQLGGGGGGAEVFGPKIFENPTKNRFLKMLVSGGRQIIENFFSRHTNLQQLTLYIFFEHNNLQQLIKHVKSFRT